MSSWLYELELRDGWAVSATALDEIVLGWWLDDFDGLHFDPENGTAVFDDDDDDNPGGVGDTTFFELTAIDDDDEDFVREIAGS